MAPIIPLMGVGALALVLLGRKKAGEKAAALPPLKDGGREVAIAPGAPTVTPGGAVQVPGVVVDVEPPIIPAGKLDDGEAVLPVGTTPEEVQAGVEALDEVQSRQWQPAVVNALKSQDAQVVETVAKAMTADGLREQAKSVQAVADDWREQAAELTAQTREEPVTPADIKQAEPPPPAPPPNPARQAAEDLATYLRPLAPWKEDRAQVKALQSELGVDPDGLYGPATATAIAEFGIIPPAPFYWPNNWQSVAAEYKRMLRARAVSDPPRALLWERAAEEAIR